jgi:hypothetical protein
MTYALATINPAYAARRNRCTVQSIAIATNPSLNPAQVV